MARKRVYTVTDLGTGNGGKGSVVHKICCHTKAHTVLKIGGAQGSHGVWTSRGQRFNFSQFGCGTLEGAHTHITDLMVVEPLGFMLEAQTLEYSYGIRGIFDMVTLDENALCITPFHTFESQLQELSRKDHPKGTVALGAGVAYMDSQAYPDLAVHVKDLNDQNLRAKLAKIQEQKIANLKTYLNSSAELLEEDQAIAKDILEKLHDTDIPRWVACEFQKMGKAARIVDREHLKRLLSQDGTMVVESSHGVLTDHYYGFYPNVSRLRTMPNRIWDLIKESGYDGELIKLGVCRAYAIRHGAGPLVTEDETFANELFPESHKGENRWQGKVRAGAMDFVALRYAINCCGGKDAFDGLAITWFDQILISGSWSVCDSYEHSNDPELFDETGEIRVRPGMDDAHLRHQEKLNMALKECTPVIRSYSVKKPTLEAIALCSAELLKRVEIPVRMISIGPTEEEKILM